MLLPTNIVAMYCPPLAVTNFNMREVKGSDCLSSSSRSLFAETKAISIPEKKAESNIVINISR